MLPLCMTYSRRLWLFRNNIYYDFAIVLSRGDTTLSKTSVTENHRVLTFLWFKEKLTNIQSLYDDVTGLKEVHHAQNRVIDAEKNFVLAQEKRRRFQNELTTLQRKLKEIYNELDKTPRGEDRYVQLITMEHSLIKEEKRLLEGFQEKEKEERDYFNTLSSAVKMGHEKERAQAERTKYWSIIGSVFGTLLGMLASSIINDLRMKELRNLVNKAVNKDADQTTKDYFDILLEHENQFKKLALSIHQLNKNFSDSITSKPVDVEFEEKNENVISTGLIASLILSATLIFVFRQ